MTEDDGGATEGNRPPVARSSEAVVIEDQPTDVELDISDPDGDEVQINIIEAPTHGTIANNGSESVVRYTPDANFHGKDHFVFQAHDGQDDSAPATVSLTITPESDPPVAENQRRAVKVATPLEFFITAVDPDGDSLRYSVVDGPKQGTLRLTGEIELGAAKAVYSPNPGFRGFDEFSFIASDENTDSEPAIVVFEVGQGNNPPVAHAGIAQSDGGPTTITLSGDDPDGDSLTFMIARPPAHGVLAHRRAQDIIYTPNPGFTGVDQLGVRAHDGQLESALAWWRIEVSEVNHPPVAESFTVDAEFGSEVPIRLRGSDPDGDDITFRVLGRPRRGLLTGEPPTLGFRQTSDSHGTAYLTYVASDGDKNSASATVTIQLNPSTGSDDGGDDGGDSGDMADTTPPSLAVLEPEDGGVVTDPRPVIRLGFSDRRHKRRVIDLDSFRLELDGLDVTNHAVVSGSGATYVPRTALGPGQHRIFAELADQSGNLTQLQSTFSFTSATATANCSPLEGQVPHTARFQSRTTTNFGSIVLTEWDFEGDGTYEIRESVPSDRSFTYRSPGTYDASLRVTTNTGSVIEDTCSIEVQGAPPTAAADAEPSNGPVPLDVGFSCDGRDADGTITLYEWDFDGDGTFDHSSTTSGTVRHIYPNNGTFSAVCRVTDNDGQTATARTSTTVIRPNPPGSPSVTAVATPDHGDAPLTVNFAATVTSSDTIDLYEWDFDGDGTYDFASNSAPTTSHLYDEGGVFIPHLRVVDSMGRAAIDTVEVVVDFDVSLTIPDDTFDPAGGETVTIDTNVGAPTQIKIIIYNAYRVPVRVLVDEMRAAGPYSDTWDGSDDAGNPLPHGVYSVIIEYDYDGQLRTVDLTHTTGGQRYNPSRNNLRGTFFPFENDYLDITAQVPAHRGASEITAYVGLFNVNTRIVTLSERQAFGVGSHTFRWDGLADDGALAQAPPGDSFLFGLWGYTLPDNAIMLNAAPALTQVMVTPNVFEPTARDGVRTGAAQATVTFTLDRTADIELTVTNLDTGTIVRNIREINVPAGAGQVTWDGKSDGGILVDKGSYRLSVVAEDSTGSRSIAMQALMEVFY